MSLTFTDTPTPGPDGSVQFGIEGVNGTVVIVTRFLDGTISLGSYNKHDDASKFYAIRVSQEAADALVGFIVNRPTKVN